MLNDLLSLGGYVLGVAGIFGSASAYFFQARSKTVIAILQDENEALRNANERLGAENTALWSKYNTATGNLTYLEKLLEKLKIKADNKNGR